MNIQERIEKMLKKADKILQAGNENKPEQLKPCPFCGSDKKLHTMALGEKEGEEIHILSCCKCDFQIKKTSEKDLFETWNKRRSDE